MRLIDADALRERMYHDAFEVDSDMQRWDSGCWIRYKMFENAIDDAPTIEPNLQPTCNQLATDCISRQAAIKAIEDLQDCYNGFSDTYDKACIIGVLEELPSAQPERRYDEWCTDCKEYDQEKHCCPRWNRVIRTTLQEVQEERKTGKWVPKADQRYYCSRCDEVAPKGIRWNFCPACGADMRGETDETD